MDNGQPRRLSVRLKFDVHDDFTELDVAELVIPTPAVIDIRGGALVINPRDTR